MNQVEAIGKGFEACTGIKKGKIVDIESTSASIKAAVIKAEQMSGMKIKSAYVNISGPHLSIVGSRTWVDISREKAAINKNHIVKVMDEIRQMRTPEGTYIIDAVRKQYRVDEGEWVSDPLGMMGMRLEVEADVILAEASSVKSIMKCMDRAGVAIEGLVIEGIASGNMYLTEEEMRAGTLLIDVGGDITDITLFKENRIVFTGYLPIGGDNITNDISIGLKMPREEAEKFKKKYDLALTSLIQHDQKETVSDIDSNGKKNVNISEMVEIVEARVCEIFSLCRDKLSEEEIGEEGISGVVITGRGIASLDGAVELAGEVFNVPVRSASLKNYSEVGPEYAVCAGMVKFVSSCYLPGTMVDARIQEKEKNRKKSNRGILQKLIDILKNLF